MGRAGMCSTQQSATSILRGHCGQRWFHARCARLPRPHRTAPGRSRIVLMTAVKRDQRCQQTWGYDQLCARSRGPLPGSRGGRRAVCGARSGQRRLDAQRRRLPRPHRAAPGRIQRAPGDRAVPGCAAGVVSTLGLVTIYLTLTLALAAGRAGRLCQSIRKCFPEPALHVKPFHTFVNASTPYVKQQRTAQSQCSLGNRSAYHSLLGASAT